MKLALQRSSGMSEAIAEPMSGAFGRDGGGASEAFEALYRRALPRVYGYVATLLRDRAAAEEVTAQAFERAYRRRRSFRASRGTQEAWLFGIARNAALDELRRRKRRAALETDPEDVAGGPRRAVEARFAARPSAPRSAGSRRGSASWWRSSSRAGSPTRRSAACSASPLRTRAPACTGHSKS